MNDLPMPAGDGQVAPGPIDATTTGQTPAVSQPVAAQAASSDPKILQDAAVEQIEAAILQTTTNPAERAVQIHAIKAAYLKNRYNIDSKSVGS